MATPLERILEAESRGLEIPVDKMERLTEARKRGLIPPLYPKTAHMAEGFEDLSEIVPQWARENPNFYGLGGAGKALSEQVVTPALEVAGGVGGAMLTKTPVGGALGYGIGKKGGEIITDQFKRLLGEGEEKTIIGETAKSAKDVGLAYVAGKAGDYLGKGLYTTEEKLARIIKKGMDKGIKPSIAKKGANAFQVQNYFDKSTSAVKSILKHTEKIPKNLEEFSSAIYNTKQRVFDMYHGMAQKAGVGGVKVNLRPIIDEMKAIASDDILLRAHPEEAARLSKMIKIWNNKPLNVSPMDAERLLKSWNQDTTGYWKNPVPGGFNAAATTERLANILRKTTAQAVETYSGPGYQTLRNEYGALSHIEKDVTNRATVDARKNAKGFFDLVDAFSTGEFVAGLTTANPAMIVKGGTMHLVKEGWKKMVNPNRYVKVMFKDASKLMGKAPETPTQALRAKAKPVEESVFSPYNPKTPKVKSPKIAPLKTTLQPGEAPIKLTPKERLLPNQRATVLEGKMGKKLTTMEDPITVGGPLKEPIVGTEKAPQQPPLKTDIVKKEAAELTKKIAKAKMLGKLNIPSSPNATIAKLKLDKFRKESGLKPLSGTPKSKISARKADQSLKEINKFRAKKGLPAISGKAFLKQLLKK